jgi:hypothetical protein
MAIRLSPSAILLRHGSCRSPGVWFPISKKQNHDRQGSRLMRWYCRDDASGWRSPDAAQRASGALLIRGPSRITKNGPGSAERYCAPHRVRDKILSSRIKDKAGDDEHSRHRQRLRERFRGCLFSGFLHSVLPRLGHSSSLRENANDVRNFTRNTPRRVFAGLSPHSGEYRRLSDSNSNAAAFWLACSRFMRSRWNFESDFRA